MNSILEELELFREQLITYYNYRQAMIRKMIGKRVKLTPGQSALTGELHDELAVKAGEYGKLIEEATGIEPVISTSAGQSNIWAWALSYSSNELVVHALDQVLQTIPLAIGNIKRDITLGIRDTEGNVIGDKRSIDEKEFEKAYEKLGGRVVGNESEVALQGTVDMTIEYIMHFVKKINSQGYTYKSTPKIGGHPDYAKPDRTLSATCAITESTEGKEREIGSIKLQLLQNERTLLKTSHPQEWDSSFKDFMDGLFTEFEQLGYMKKERTATVAGSPPKAFIAHGGRSGILDKLREFIEALGIEPIIVELSPTKGMNVDEKVNKYIKDADCGIVLATKGGIVDTRAKKPKQHPRLNVIDELERLRTAFPEGTILLVEKGVELPSNISGLTHESFAGQSMDRAFIAIARELAALGILKAAKPL